MATSLYPYYNPDSMEVMDGLEEAIRKNEAFGVTLGGFSPFAKLPGAPYSDDLIGQILHTPVFDAPVPDKPEDMPVDITAWHRLNALGGLKAEGEVPSLGGLKKINPAAELITQDALYEHIPEFPDIVIRPSSFQKKHEHVEGVFTKEWLNSSQCSRFCNVYVDDKKSIYVVMKPASIIYYTRRLLEMTLNTDAEVKEMCSLATQIRACTRVAINNLKVFSATPEVDMVKFRKAVAKNGPYRPDMLDLDELMTYRMIFDTLCEKTEFKQLEHQKTWFVGWLLADWMRIANAIASEMIRGPSKEKA